MFDIPVSIAAALVGGLADVLRPVAGGLATALAIVVFTALVRLLMVPLAVAAARGERTRVRLLPRIQKLQKRHAKDPQRLRREMAALYEAEGGSPVAGCLPMLAQIPFFMVMYRLFVSATIAGHQNLLLAHMLFAAPLGQNWIGVVGGGLFSPPSLVFLGLFALLAAVAVWSSRRVTAEGPMGTAARLVPFGTIVVAAFVPLAAGVYLLTSGAWTAVERAVLRRWVVAAP
ncbi:YidC/Oxa1 family membrane protein insertase [Actinomadura sp. KC216]|uniref:YidC/Oxa1 family membrane protein insertase n=1 Tax=Actinomadura sp. KC216 TaxID=2530370 RepID=UPI001044441B|nr:YidC/Oxa1 family membrane protein insertase [Actinomadura sp. KC216]TDB82955.1 YidC/Oxa1 family membrane protein insertase [Actinomadura sp. KC216]